MQAWTRNRALQEDASHAHNPHRALQEYGAREQKLDILFLCCTRPPHVSKHTYQTLIRYNTGEMAQVHHRPHATVRKLQL